MDPVSVIAGGHPDIHQQHQYPGISPDMAGLLGGGLGAPGEASGPTAPPPGAPPEATPEAPPEDTGGGQAQNEAEAYDSIINSISDVMGLDTVTEVERATLHKAQGLIQGLLAANEKAHMQAGANPAIQKAMMGG